MNGGRNETIIPEIFLEGLSYDVSILHALLKRHRSSHGRTIYFRRMNMTLKCLKRQQKMIMVENVYRVKELQKNINQYHQELNRKKKLRQRHGTEEEEEWCLQPSHNNKTAAAAATTKTTRTVSKFSILVDELQKLILVWTQHIPEILSRIRHSSLALIKEVSRGFFLPFCTVALGALARIRSIVMGIVGLRGLTILYNLQSELSSDNILKKELSTDDNNKHTLCTTTRMTMMMMTNRTYTKYMDMFLEKNDNINTNYNYNKSANNHEITIDRSAILRSLGLMESNVSLSTMNATTNNTDNNQMMSLTSIATATLQTTIELEDDDDNQMKYHADVDDKYTNNLTNNDDSIPVDQNMALVDSYQKRVKAQKKTKTKTKTSNSKDASDKKKKKKNRKKIIVATMESETAAAAATTTTTTTTKVPTTKEDKGKKNNKKRKSTTTKTMDESESESLQKKGKKKKNRKKKTRKKNMDIFDQLFD
mmetsp:Transcript_19441/g.22421  ORF Transcript_19441/g.22421 Transcript_19441/m.22421 type:complete len:479 (+) Transcript_19441:40-1476(+)